jgi:hypothetical protein
MDYELQKALNVVRRAGPVGMQQLLDIFPVLRHKHNVVGRFDPARPRVAVERSEEWQKWADKMPAIQFPSHWKVRIIPPTVGAMVRFVVEPATSVFLDCHSSLGHRAEPYWEVYPANGDVGRCDMNDVDGLLSLIAQSQEDA